MSILYDSWTLHSNNHLSLCWNFSVFLICLLKQWFNLTTILLNRSQHFFLFFFMEYSSLLIPWGIFCGSSAAPDISVDAREILKLKKKALKENLKTLIFLMLQGSCRYDCVHVNALRNGSVVSHGLLPCGNRHRWPLFSLFTVMGCSAPKIK